MISSNNSIDAEEAPPALVAEDTSMYRHYFAPPRGKRTLCAALCAVVLFIVVGIPLLATRDNRGPPDYDIYTVADRGDIVHPVVLELSDKYHFLNAESPQSQALAYLLHHDQTVDLTSAARIAQRYAILVLFYQNGGLVAELELRKEGLAHECRLWECDDNGALLELDLHGSALVGVLPDELGILTNLKTLNLGRNRLQGPFPNAVLSQMTQLGTLHTNNPESDRLSHHYPYRDP